MSFLPIELLYKADEIIELRNARLDTLYTPGADYTVEDGKLVIPSGSAVKKMPYNEFFLKHEIPGKCFGAERGGYIMFAQGSELHDRQLAVTYRHSGTWCGNIPPDKSELLPRTIKKLRNGEEITILVFGDSISTGANSSKVVDAPPFAEDWCTMTVRGLESRYGNAKIRLVNKAVGGTVSAWGAQNAREASACIPDLAIIGFGMNDGSGKVPTEEYEKNTREIMRLISAESPECEFVLIATTLAHSEVKGFFGIQEDYLPILTKLQHTGVAVADMTTLHKQLLGRKRFFDMSGNNVNHPNDFLARAYAQCLLATLGAI